MPDNDSSSPSNASLPGVELPDAPPARSTPKLEVLKIGSDPEALFTTAAGMLIEATRYVGRTRIMSAWIGTDGNSATAELRPRPAKDVLLHVRDIAEAMSVIYETVCKDDLNVHMVAQPYHEPSSSPCGGHVHFSFLLHDPIAVPMIIRGHVLNTTGNILRDIPVADRAFVRATTPPTVRSRYLDAAIANTAFSFRALKDKLFSVIGPLENNLYPIGRRLSRNYGNGEDAIRAEFSPTLIKPGTVRWRLEYRYPSTWLAHPALALAYLGLTKLAVNNYHTGLTYNPTGPLTPLPGHIDEFLRQPEAVVTPDVQHLPRVLRFIMAEIAPRLSAPNVQVDFEAWTKFLNEGRWK